MEIPARERPLPPAVPGPHFCWEALVSNLRGARPVGPGDSTGRPECLWLIEWFRVDSGSRPPPRGVVELNLLARQKEKLREKCASAALRKRCRDPSDWVHW